MKARFTQWILLSALNVAWLTAMGGCSTTQITPPPAPPPPPPAYVQVPHPMGADLGDVIAIMQLADAPSRDSLKDCDSDVLKLISLTKSDEERRQGARELVKKDPVQYHWCFYSKVLELEETLRKVTFIDERQKTTIQTYQFMVPVARGFLAEFRDTRYLRWAIVHYRRISEWVFFRKMDLSPAATSELVQVSNPFGLWRDPTPEATILEKYGISKPSDEARAGAEVKTIFPKEMDSASSDVPPEAPPEAQVGATAPEAERKVATGAAEGAPIPDAPPLSTPAAKAQKVAAEPAIEPETGTESGVGSRAPAGAATPPASSVGQ